MNKEQFKKKFDRVIQKSHSEIPKAVVELKNGERIVATNYSILDYGDVVFINLKYEGLGAENYHYPVLLEEVAYIY